MKKSHICWKARETWGRMSVAALAGLLLCSVHVAMAVDGLIPGFTSQNQVVGECGDLGRAIFVGNETFGAETLRRGLEFDLDSALAIQPDVKLGDCLHTLELRLRAGYELAGFPETEVHAEADPGARRILLRITEGRRCYCGKVRVEGLKSLVEESVSAQISRRIALGAETNSLTSLLQGLGKTNLALPEKPLSIPRPGITIITNRGQVENLPPGIWEAGKPAPLNAAARKSLTVAVSNAFADLGHFNARFTLVLTPPVSAISDPPSPVTRRLLDLVVKVQDEGPACTIGEIEVSPLRKNSRDEVISWLGLASGQPLTGALLLEKQAQLVESGRFTVAQLEPGTPDATGKVKIRLVLRELEIAPPLSAALSPTETAVQRLRLWLQDWHDGNEDAVLTVQGREGGGTNGYSAELIVSPQSGLLIRVNTAHDSASAADWVFYADSDAIALFDVRRREGIRVATNGWGGMQLKAGLGVYPDGTGSFSLGGGITSTNLVPFLNIDLQLVPAAFIRLADHPEIDWQNEHGLLIGTSSNTVLQVDARTGRLVELRAHAGDSLGNMSALISGHSNVEPGFVLHFRTNAFAEAISQVMVTTSGFTNCYEERHPSSSILAFLTQAAIRASLARSLTPTNVSAEVIAAGASIYLKLLDREFFAASDGLFGPANSAGEEAAFIIPPDEASAPNGSSPLDFVAAWSLHHTGEVIASESWLGTMLSESALGLSRRPDLAGKGWRRIATSPDTGPLACLVAARCVNAQNARVFAIKGLTCLSREDFLHDCRPLLDGDGALPVTLRNLLMRLASLDDSSFNSLAAICPPADADFLRETVHILRQPGMAPSETVLTPALEHWWDAAMRKRVSGALRRVLIKPSS